MAKSFSFSELSNSLQDINPDGGILSDAPLGKIEEYIPTGNYALNALMSGDMFKGIPGGRITMFAGESGSGKTFLALNACREAQRMGYSIVYIDTEFSIDIEGIQRFGIDPSKLSYQPIGTVNEVSTFLLNLTDTLKEKRDAGFKIPKVMVVIDSLGNLSSDKEIEDIRTSSGKADYTRPKELKRLFRICRVKMGVLKIPVIVTNHTYVSIGSFIPQQEIGGGTGPFYNADIIAMLSKAQLKEDGKTQTGIIVTVKLKKARLTQAGKPIKMHISFINGMNRFTGLEKFIQYSECGIGPGKLIEEILAAPGKAGKTRKVKTGNYEYVEDKSEKPKSYAVEHLGKTIKPNMLFRGDVFTQEVLDRLNVRMKQEYEFPEYTEDMSIEEYAEMESDLSDDLGIGEEDILGEG